MYVIFFEDLPQLTHIFIHIEGLYILKGNLALFVELNQLLVHSQWSGSRGQAQNKVSEKMLTSLYIYIKDNDKNPYLSALGLKSLIRFITYLAAHLPTESLVSNITNLMF